MASSKTEALAPAGSRLRAVLDMAQRREVAGNTPFFLNEPQICWWVDAGRIELFVVQIRNGEPYGARHHFTSIEPGAFLFGLSTHQNASLAVHGEVEQGSLNVAPEALLHNGEGTRSSRPEPAIGAGGQLSDAGFALLAVPHVNTQVRRLHLVQLQEPGSSLAHELAGPIDSWVTAISSGLAGWVMASPVVHQSVRAGATITMPANQRVAAGQGVVWLEFPRDTALFLDTQDLPPGAGPCLLPLSPDSWVQSGEALELAGKDSVQVLSEGKMWQGLDTLHEILMPAVQTNLMLSSVDEHNRLRRRSESALRDWNRGLDQLQGVLDGRQAEALYSDDGLPLLAQALQAVGQVEGFRIRLPVRSSFQDGDTHDDLSAILHASGLRARQVLLQPGWEQYDTEAMLGFAKDDGRPLAILPRAGKTLQVIDPRHQHVLEGKQALAILAEDAYAITAPLPFSALDWKALPRFTLKRGWRELLVLLLTGLCGGLLGMAVPIASSHLIDTVIPGHDRSHLIQLGIILVVLGLATFVMSYVGGVAFSRFQARAGPALQAAIIDRLLRLPVGFFRNYSAGDLALRASAITQIDQLISSSVAQAILGGIFAVFSFALLLYYDWRLGLVAALLTLAYSVFFLLLVWLQVRQERHRARMDGQLQSMVLQMVSGIAKIRLSASESRAFSRWAGLFAQYQKLSQVTGRYANLQEVLNVLFGLLPLLVFFLILGYFRDPQQVNVFAVGGLAAFLSAFNRFHGSATQMTQTVVAVLAVRPLLERAMPILSATPEISDDRDDPGTLSGAVEFSRVSFRYTEDGPLILDDVSLSVKAGEFIAIVGASGCGKSTLMRLLLGFETPESGRVLLDGKDMGELDVLAVRRQMGVVLQNSRPMSGSLYENIVGASHRGLADAWEAARKAGLAEDIERMPMGMHTMVTEGGSLSGGQIQRLMIARAIVGNPRILVLDEATSALDNRVQALITESLDSLSVTRIVVAHRLSTVVKANRIYVMDAGRVVEEGSFEELMQKDGAFARLAAAQLV